MTVKKGIDVSYWQGNIDWKKVKESGVEFAILRAGYGQGNIDKQFIRNVMECNQKGIPCGAYWFSYAYTVEMARKEAKYFLETVAPYKLEYPLMFDFEYDSINSAKKKGVNLSAKLISDMAAAFCEEIEKAGYYAMIYTNLDYLQKYLDTALRTKYDVWLAAWPNNPSAAAVPMKVNLWQYSSKGSVAGIQGNVDMDYAYLDFPELLRTTGLNKLGTTKPQPDPAVNQESWYDKATAWCKENEIMLDDSRPSDGATRAEVAQALYSFYQRFGKEVK